MSRNWLGQSTQMSCSCHMKVCLFVFVCSRIHDSLVSYVLTLWRTFTFCYHNPWGLQEEVFDDDDDHHLCRVNQLHQDTDHRVGLSFLRWSYPCYIMNDTDTYRVVRGRILSPDTCIPIPHTLTFTTSILRHTVPLIIFKNRDHYFGQIERKPTWQL